MKPISTEYKGEIYRSRLEARWAVFFDEIGFAAQYEPFEIKSKDGLLTYLPDFFVIYGFDKPCFIEIKPVKPNESYIKHLLDVFNEDLMPPADILILVGNPDFHQPDGVWITRYSNQKEDIEKGASRFRKAVTYGVTFEKCQDCGNWFWFEMEFGWNSHQCSCIETNDYEEARIMAENYRFDL